MFNDAFKYVESITFSANRSINHLFQKYLDKETQSEKNYENSYVNKKEYRVYHSIAKRNKHVLEQLVNGDAPNKFELMLSGNAFIVPLRGYKYTEGKNTENEKEIFTLSGPVYVKYKKEESDHKLQTNNAAQLLNNLKTPPGPGFNIMLSTRLEEPEFVKLVYHQKNDEVVLKKAHKVKKQGNEMYVAYGEPIFVLDDVFNLPLRDEKF